MLLRWFESFPEQQARLDIIFSIWGFEKFRRYKQNEERGTSEVRTNRSVGHFGQNHVLIMTLMSAWSEWQSTNEL